MLYYAIVIAFFAVPILIMAFFRLTDNSGSGG